MRGSRRGRRRRQGCLRRSRSSRRWSCRTRARVQCAVMQEQACAHVLHCVMHMSHEDFSCRTPVVYRRACAEVELPCACLAGVGGAQDKAGDDEALGLVGLLGQVRVVGAHCCCRGSARRQGRGRGLWLRKESSHAVRLTRRASSDVRAMRGKTLTSWQQLPGTVTLPGN